MISANSFNTLYKFLIKEVLDNGKKVSPRGLPCLELSPAIFELKDIQKSLLTLKERKLSYKFAAAEKLCYITGKGGEDILPKYAPNIARFINKDTGKFSGAYGPRLIKQYKYVLDLLKKDPDTRQAVLNVYNYHDDHHDDPDVSCTVLLQFLIRDNKLDLIVYLRSNDLLWGVPYDFSAFTFIQESFANILGVGLGKYTHITGSLHIYEKDIPRFEKIYLSDELVDERYHQRPVDIKTYKQLQDQSSMTLLNDLYPNSHDFSQPLLPFFDNLHTILWKNN